MVQVACHAGACAVSRRYAAWLSKYWIGVSILPILNAHDDARRSRAASVGGAIVTLSKGSSDAGNTRRQVHGTAAAEPVPAVVGTADRIRRQHHARLRRRLGRRRDEDHRAAPGRQRRRPKDQVPARQRRLAATVDAEAARNGAPLLLELGAHLRQAAGLVGAAY